MSMFVPNAQPLAMEGVTGPYNKTVEGMGEDMNVNFPPPVHQEAAVISRQMAGTDEKAKDSQSPELIAQRKWGLCMEQMHRMRNRERRLHYFNPKAPYIQHRRVIVDWMKEVCRECHLKRVTFHSAVAYLDRVLSTSATRKNRFQLVALVCILIAGLLLYMKRVIVCAAKFQENEGYVPSLDHLNECASSVYTVDAIVKMESLVLDFIGWELGVVTVASYLRTFECAVISEDEMGANPEKTVKEIKDFVDRFANLALEDYSFNVYLPSVVAASATACARHMMKLNPIWTPTLEALTSCSSAEVFPVFNHMCKLHEIYCPSASKVSPKSVQAFQSRTSAS